MPQEVESERPGACVLTRGSARVPSAPPNAPPEPEAAAASGEGLAYCAVGPVDPPAKGAPQGDTAGPDVAPCAHGSSIWLSLARPICVNATASSSRQ